MRTICVSLSLFPGYWWDSNTRMKTWMIHHKDKKFKRVSLAVGTWTRSWGLSVCQEPHGFFHLFQQLLHCFPSTGQFPLLEHDLTPFHMISDLLVQELQSKYLECLCSNYTFILLAQLKPSAPKGQGRQITAINTTPSISFDNEIKLKWMKMQFIKRTTLGVSYTLYM